MFQVDLSSVVNLLECFPGIASRSLLKLFVIIIIIIIIF
jgi:hypothetical protein